MDKTEEYLVYLSERNRKQKTIQTYRSYINRCLTELEENGMSTDPEKIGERELWFLISNMPGKEQTVKMYVAVLNGWIMHYTNVNNLARMRPLWNRTVKKRLFISKNDFFTVYREADPRCRLILMLGSCMGLRRSEIWGIELSDIRDGSISIRGKGHGADGLSTKNLMPSPVIEEIKSYMKWRSKFKGKDKSLDKLLVYKDHEGNIRPYERSESIGHLLKALSRKTGVEITPHSLRRLFATELKKSGCELVEISHLMRHASINTTVIYFDEDKNAQNAALEKMSSGFVMI